MTFDEYRKILEVSGPLDGYGHGLLAAFELGYGQGIYDGSKINQQGQQSTSLGDPVAWVVYENWRKNSVFFKKEVAENFKNESQKNDDLSGNLSRWSVVPLYAATQQKEKP